MDVRLVITVLAFISATSLAQSRGNRSSRSRESFTPAATTPDVMDLLGSFLAPTGLIGRFIKPEAGVQPGDIIKRILGQVKSIKPAPRPVADVGNLVDQPAVTTTPSPAQIRSLIFDLARIDNYYRPSTAAHLPGVSPPPNFVDKMNDMGVYGKFMLELLEEKGGIEEFLRLINDKDIMDGVFKGNGQAIKS